MNALVSVVIPVYNVEEYLEEAINSVIYQTYNNIEIILVDDGSTDSSAKICDLYKEKDDRVIVIHDKNEGLSEARNRGIRIAKGEYICFLDSDDYLDATFVEKLYNAIEQSEADMAICPLIKVYPDNTKTSPTPVQKYEVLDVDEAFVIMFSQSSHIGVHAVNKMYRLSLFRDILFPYGKYYEDSGTTYKLVDLCKKIVYYKEPLYYYRLGREGSIVSDKSKLNRYLDKCDFMEAMDAFFSHRKKEVKDAFLQKYLKDIMVILDQCVMQGQVGTELWIRAKAMFMKYKKQIIISKIPIGRKMKGVCMLLGDRVFILFCKAKGFVFHILSYKGLEA